MSAPLCDAVLDTTRSGRVLRGAGGVEPAARRRSTRPTRVVPVPPYCSASCCAASSAQRANPSAVAGLHLRAVAGARRTACGRWRSSMRRPVAIPTSTTLVVGSRNRRGRRSHRHGAALDGMGRGRELVDRYPAVAVHGALIYALLGHAIDAERWAIAADRTVSTEVLADGSTMDSYVAYMRALLGREGIEAMGRDARCRMGGPEPRQPVPLDDAAHRSDGRLLRVSPTSPIRSDRGLRRGDADQRGSVRRDDPGRAVRHHDGQRRLEGAAAAVGQARAMVEASASTTTGRARSCTPSRRARRPSRQRAHARRRRARPDSAPSSPTRSPSYPSRH